ncbi:MAG: DUF1501 domain-containing protein [Planctomycetes bacterium]|nr:DUF1501 domain-containing protein [Planctomycetota bacterium]
MPQRRHQPGSAQARWTRRRLLEVGGISLLGLGLPELLWAGARGASSAGARGSASGGAAGRHNRGSTKAEAEPGNSGRAAACIFIVQYGGASHIDTLDPKPGAPEEIRGAYPPIATSVPGVQISALLPQLARLADRYCLVRSMSHGAADHDGGMHVCMTGHSVPADSTPCFGSVTARLRPAERNLPSYVWLQNLDADVRLWYRTGGFLGEAYSPLLVGAGADNPSASGFRMLAFDPPAGFSLERLRNRDSLLSNLEPPASRLLQSPSAQSMAQFHQRAMEMVTGPEARRAFDLALEPPQLRDRYGRHPIGQNLLLARRLVEAGVRLVTVNAWAGVPAEGQGFIYSPNFTQGWDHHGAAVQQCGIFSTGQFGLGFVLPRFDQAVSALLEDLAQRGLLESTLVVVVGEFGRTPKVVSNPYPGRDHWPQCYSALLAGGGIRGGTVYGTSDRIGAYVKDKPVRPEDFGATLLYALSMSPETRLGKDGFTQPASTGQPVFAIFG